MGSSAVVCAPSQEEAALTLQRALEGRGIPQIVLAKDMVKFNATVGNCLLITDRSY